MNKISTIVLAGSLVIIMLGMGLSLVLDDFKRIVIYPKAILLGLTNQLIILPLVGFGLVSLFPLQPEIAIGVMILAASLTVVPAGHLSMFLASDFRGWFIICSEFCNSLESNFPSFLYCACELGSLMIRI